MSDLITNLITDEKLGHMASKLWSDYVKGLVSWDEFTMELLEIMITNRGTDNV